ncbi:glycoside hydrolase, family GH13_19 lipoprotein precursor. Probable alpha-amylase [Tenacibaculum litopenaei]|uniref:alpha-amylase family glycosyl hydrolase n=1 Tax=Tenacibaculum litopenaei TaxID=396016 RepID=UPI0038964A7E
MKKVIVTLAIAMGVSSCTKPVQTEQKTVAVVKKQEPFDWRAATVYFLLTDRFNNGNTDNDLNFDRSKQTAKLRGFKGGDLAGVTQKIKEGYFDALGVNAIWMSPVLEQNHGAVDEGTGATYGFHGYWTQDWTRIDPNFGTEEELRELIKTAHEHGIKILLDAVVNHTGPVTEKDAVWPASWVRTTPQCEYKDYASTVSCTLVRNLPDIRTESDEEVSLPPQLLKKWKAEGRLEQELLELDTFFNETGYPRAPRFYIMKWLADYIEEFGIDGYRVDTVKHVEEKVWQEFKQICDRAFENYKKKHPKHGMEKEFYLVGEVYGYGISGGREYAFSDRKVDYFDKSFQSLINFEFKWNAKQLPYEALFKKYDSILQGDLKGKGVLNYTASHDDGQPYDADRTLWHENAIRLLLSPGTAQIYYGDEVARPLKIQGAEGDANLRSLMPWQQMEERELQEIAAHWQKLGSFRSKHPSIGAGKHEQLTATPYVFSRRLKTTTINDSVVVGLGLPQGEKTIEVKGVFADGTSVRDAYSGTLSTVTDGKVSIATPFTLLLLEEQSK